MAIPKVNHKELEMFMSLSIATDEPLLIVGKPGEGKSTHVFEFAQSIGYQVILSIPALDDPSKYKGYPAKCKVKLENNFTDYGFGKYQADELDDLLAGLADDNDKSTDVVEEELKEIEAATHLPYDEILKLLTTTVNTIWFIDDLGQSPTLCQAALMQALEARFIAGYKIPDCVRIFAATNAREHGSGVKGLLEAVKSRFGAIVELVTSVEDVRIYGAKNGWYQPILDFLSAYEQEGVLQDFQLNIGMEQNTCPRVFYKLSKGLLAGGKDWPDTQKEPMRMKLCCSFIGEKWGRQLAAHLNWREDMPSYYDIVSDPENFPLDQKMDQRFAIIGMLATEGKPEDADAIFKWIRKTKKECQVVFMQTLSAKKSKLRDTAPAQLWTTENIEIWLG